MLTGYNTDVEHDGVVYHVQTEDKGLETPIILSLVYTGGAILASKRSPYDDLIAGGLNEDILAERLQRQHKLICAAVHAGRIEDLKRLSGRELAEKRTRRKKPVSPEPIEPPQAPETPIAGAEVRRDDSSSLRQDRFSISGTFATDDSVQVKLLEERDLHAGEFVTLRVLVSRATLDGRVPVPKARVILKTLGTSFRPTSTFSVTDKDGVALVFASLPKFETGRAAILVRAEVDGETAELRRIIMPV